MASDVAIRDGLVTRLNTIAGLTGYDHVPGQVNTPAGMVQRRITRFDDTAGRGSDDHEYLVTIVVSLADYKVAQEQMSKYLAGSGPDSVKAAIEGDPTLGGAAHFARVREAGEELVREFGEVQCMTVEFTVEVTADGA